MPQQPQYLSTDPHAGVPASGNYLSTDPHAGTAPPPPSDTWGDAAKALWDNASPVQTVKGLYGLVKDPAALIRANPQFLQDAKAAYDKGDYETAGRKVLSYMLMGLGSQADAQADMLQQGRYKTAAGSMAGEVVGALAPEAAVKTGLGVAKAASGLMPANPAVADAVRFGQANGVPVDAATATDNAAVRAAQHLTDRSLGGAQIAGRAAQAGASGLATLGEQLASKGYAQSMTAESAGTAVRDAVTGNVATLGGQADTAYTKLRAIEAQHPIPVNLEAAKAAIEPIYATMAKGADIAPLQGSKAVAARAMARLLNSPDVVGASEADSALSDLKAMQRDAQGTPGAGAINRVVSQVHQAVTQAVAQAGPQAMAALNEGRSATTAKYVAQDVLDNLNAEPVKTVRTLTANADANIQQLRAVAQQAPQALPQIGRSVLDGMLDRATESGGFAHADKLYADWQKLGDETKGLLFKDPAYRNDLNNFFLLAKKMGENANPSGTAHTAAMLAQGMTLWRPLDFAATVGGSAGLSAFLHSDAGVRLLTEGVITPPSPMAQQLWMTRARQFAAVQRAALGAQPSGSPQ